MKHYHEEDIEYENGCVYISGDYYGTEKEFYEDLEKDKICTWGGELGRNEAHKRGIIFENVNKKLKEKEDIQ